MVIDSLSLLNHLGWAVMAGVLLNLTPCVLPAIPIKVRTIIKEAGSDAGNRVLAALAFFSGVMVFFLTIAGLTAFLHWQWGALFQSQAMIAVVVVLLAGFAVVSWLDLSMPVPGFAANTRGHRFVEAFLSGLFSSILAAPCAGPLMGGVLVFAMTRSEPLIFLIFAALGMGLALPYMLLILNPHWLSRLPRPGPWAVAVRQGLAFILVAGAIFFGKALLASDWSRILWWSWVGTVALWASWQIVRKDWATKAVALSVCGGALLVAYIMAGPSQAPTINGIGWRPYSKSLLKAAKREGRPYLVEFTADWCINCQVLERTVYRDQAVTHRIHQDHVLAMHVDLTDSNPVGEAALARFGGHALPFSVVVGADGHPDARFTGLFTTNQLLAAMNRVNSRKERHQ